MMRKLFYNPQPQPPATERRMTGALLRLAIVALACVPSAFAGGDAPQWMHALVNAPLPPQSVEMPVRTNPARPPEGKPSDWDLTSASPAR